MARKLSDLMDMMESGIVLVFPTEESARAFSSLYVLTRKRGLLASSCIAFDSFASQFMSEIKGKTPAGDIDRMIFSSYASTILYDRFRYYTSPDYPEMQSRLPSFFRPMLPHLDDALSLKQKSREAVEDLLLLRREYGAFLSASSLYESSFVPLSIPARLEAHYAVVMPSAFPKESRIVNALSSHPDVTVADDLSSPIPRLSVYQNEKGEIRSLFAEIRRLADCGVTLDEIAVSVSALERLRPYIEDEAYIFGIPLDFREGVLVSSTAPGAFISALSEIYTSSYSLDALKAFFLNPSIPFREPDKMRTFIAEAVRFSITSAPLRRGDRYMKLPAEAGAGYYRVLRLTLDRLMSETDPDKIEGLVHTLMSSLLKDEEFHGSEEDENIYSFTMNALSDFISHYKTAVSSSYAAPVPVFPLFLNYFSLLRYVPRNRTEGVAVYPFTQDAAVPYKYRFIIALNSKEGAVTVSKASFLSDYSLAEEREEEDITETILSLYAAVTEHLVLSASNETYAGFALPVTSLLDSAVSASPVPDPLRAEEKKEECTLLPVQMRGYQRAVISSLRKRSAPDDMTLSKRGKERPLPVPLSFSSYNAYTKCPYLYALQYVFRLRNLPSYEPVEMDHMQIGIRLHSILERFYRIGGKSVSELFDEEMAAWSDGMSYRDDGTLGPMPPSASRPTPFLIHYLRVRYLSRLESVVRKMDELSTSLPGGKGIEEALSASFEELGLIVDGRADRIAIKKDGSGYIIYDYKKGRSFAKDERAEKSYQFHFYKLLLSADPSFPLPVCDAYFVSLMDGAFTEASPAPDEKTFKENLSTVSSSIASGDWHAQSSDINCKGCVYRAICRRRFSVR